MNVRVLYFGLIRERLRRAEEAIELPARSTAHDLLSCLVERYDNDLPAGLRTVLRVAVNQALVPLSHPLEEDDEVALIPPVSGGGPHCRLSRAPLDLAELVQAVGGPTQGGIVTFSGVVRTEKLDGDREIKVIRLEYEAYDGMALRAMAAIVTDLEAAQPGVRVAMVHRVGVLQPGEVAVVIAASAVHRAAAFAACQQAIDRLKQDVPIWKKEVTEDGAEWVGHRP